MNKNEIEMAEQQFTGYAHGKAGFSIEALASDMGLTREEWLIIKERNNIHLFADDALSLDNHFGV
jgi:hypothetical protein